MFGVVVVGVVVGCKSCGRGPDVFLDGVGVTGGVGLGVTGGVGREPDFSSSSSACSCIA